MERLIAILALVAAGFFIVLGNFWFTYGIWPRSWTSFTAFFCLGLANTLLLQTLRERKVK
jgi:hypothetical protein